MREIRFRAWDTTKKKMHHEISLMFANDLNGVFEGLNECDCIVMQYTGLKDKNGTEIYEGDIVNCWGGEWVFGVWEYLEIIEKLDIREMYELTNVNWAGIEVVGNIHDNPELLKEQ